MRRRKRSPILRAPSMLMLSTADIEEKFGFSPAQSRRMAKDETSDFPAPMKIYGRYYWSYADVLQWLAHSLSKAKKDICKQSDDILLTTPQLAETVPVRSVVQLPTGAAVIELPFNANK